MQATHCPVCGFGPFVVSLPYSELATSFDICPCCHAEYGNDDSERYQANWVSIFHPDIELGDWSCHDQLKHAIKGWGGWACGYASNSDFQQKYAPLIGSCLACLAGPNPQLRLSAVCILGCLDDIRVEPALRLASSDPDEDIRWFAQLALEGRRRDRETLTERSRSIQIPDQATNGTKTGV